MALGDAAFSSGDVMRRLKAAEDAAREAKAGRRLENATIGAGGLRVAGAGVIRSTDFDGDMVAGDPGANGWALGAERLALRGELISPVAFGGARDVRFGITLKTGAPGEPGEIHATAGIPVPDWAEEAIVLATADATGDNNTAQNDDAFLVYAQINGVNGHENMARVPSNIQVPASASMELLITNPGEVITVACGVRTNIVTWTGTNSRAAINAIAVFRRTT